MPRSKSSSSVVAEFTRIHEEFSGLFPHVSAIFGDAAEFNGLVLKVRDDGTVLAVLKAFGSDGAPIVCFGTGYGPVGALHGLDRSVQGGSWKKDKPWPGGSS